MKLLRSCKMRIVPEEEKLAERKEVKERLGYVPRPRQGEFSKRSGGDAMDDMD